ncbi:MAG: hypothetical protein ACRD4O_14780 [Bryobacteraceae bacterium]
MNLDESRGCLDRAEASLRDAAAVLIRFPLDPGRALAALERAKLALEALCRDWQRGNRELTDACRRAGREAARVQRLLEAAAMFSFRCFSETGAGADSYTPAGECRSAAQIERFVLQG